MKTMSIRRGTPALVSVLFSAFVLGFAFVLSFALVVPAFAQDAASLKAKHDAIPEKLAANPFKRPLALESTQSSGDLKGDVYAVVDQPFSVVGPALQGMDHWCDLLILHLNAAFRALTDGVFMRPEALERDVKSFFSLPIPHAVWEELKTFQDQDFIKFVKNACK